jgi:hypothetical protein
MSSPVTVERLERAINVTAQAMADHNLPQLLLTLKRLEAGRDRLLTGGDPLVETKPVYGPDDKPVSLHRHYDREGRLLYVGIAADSLRRLSGHRYKSNWRNEIVRVDVEHFPKREGALAAERTAIRIEKPLHNVVGKVSTASELGAIRKVTS